MSPRHPDTVYYPCRDCGEKNIPSFAYEQRGLRRCVPCRQLGPPQRRADPVTPKQSWWIGASPEGFTQVAAQHTANWRTAGPTVSVWPTERTQ